MRIILAGLLLLGGCLNVMAAEWALPSGFWFQPRSADRILQQAEIRSAVSDLLAKPQSMMLLHHAPGDESAMQAAELRYWLIGLAVDGKRIGLQADLPANQPIKIEIR